MTHTTPTPDGQITAHEAIHILRLALVSAECAIKGREHTSFITKALAATECIAQAAPAGDAVAGIIKEIRAAKTLAMRDSLFEKLVAELEGSERATTQPAGEAQVVGRVHHRQFGVIAAVLNSVGRDLRDGAALYAAPISEDAGEAHFEEQPDGTVTPVDPADLSAQQQHEELKARFIQVITSNTSFGEHRVHDLADALVALAGSWREAGVEEASGIAIALLGEGRDLLRRAEAAEKERDDLRAQLATELKRVASYTLMVSVKDKLIANLNAQIMRHSEAINTLASERECNARLTAELAQLARPADLAGLTRYGIGIVERDFGVWGFVQKSTGHAVMFADVQALLAGKVILTLDELIEFAADQSGYASHTDRMDRSELLAWVRGHWIERQAQAWAESTQAKQVQQMAEPRGAQ